MSGRCCHIALVGEGEAGVDADRSSLVMAVLRD